ncbi:MAG: hypothetical protein ACM3JD_16455 [Rudaea sp.]
MNKIIALLMLATALAACSSQPNPVAPGFSQPVPNRIAPAPPNSGATAVPALQVILVPSELIVGPNRFAIGLIDPQRGMIHDATVHFRYFDLRDPTKPTLESEADATELQTPDGESTIFAQEREFARAGSWGVEVQARLPDGSTLDRGIGFKVVDRSATLKPGDRVPSLQTRTYKDVDGNLHQLTSAPNPNPAFYRLSLAQALTNGKPTVLLFSTPAFCQTRLCGPAYDLISQLERQYRDQVNFIHVEVYRGLPNPAETNWELDPAMTAFGLQTEPWVYVIDKGVVTFRVEGLFTGAEIEQHLKALGATAPAQEGGTANNK